MSELSDIEYKIIGEGNDGFIIEPSISGLPNKVTKVGLKQKIEYEKSIQLPLFLSGYLYLNPEEYEYSEITPEEYQKITGRKTKKIYQCLTMNKIEGKSLFDFLECTYATVESWTNKYSERYKQNYIIIGIDEFKELYLRLKIFSNLCQMMNSAGIFHNDIGSQNIMVTKDKQLFLIDFYNVTFGSPLKLPFLKVQKNDMDSINSIFNELIDVGLFNHEVYEYCISNSIIIPFEIDYKGYNCDTDYENIALQIINKNGVKNEKI